VTFNNAAGQMEFIPQSVGDSIAYGFGKTGDTFKLMAQIPAQIISGVISPEQARPVSIIGISQLGGQFLQRSLIAGAPYYVLEFVALISIFLGVSNILPLFPLPVDGTRIVFVIIEMVRGKPVPLHIENMVYRVGLAILLVLSIAIILLDIFFPLI
jgi:regulator of sigma E protease